MYSVSHVKKSEDYNNSMKDIQIFLSNKENSTSQYFCLQKTLIYRLLQYYHCAKKQNKWSYVENKLFVPFPHINIRNVAKDPLIRNHGCIQIKENCEQITSQAVIVDENKIPHDHHRNIFFNANYWRVSLYGSQFSLVSILLRLISANSLWQ